MTRLTPANVDVKLGRLDNASDQLDRYLDKAAHSPIRTQAEQLRKGIQEILKRAAN